MCASRYVIYSFIIIIMKIVKALSFAFVAVAAAVPASLESRQTTCAAGVHLIVARGTFEPQGHSLQDPIVSAIVNKIPGSDATQVVYPASPIDITGSLASGVANAQQQINDYVAACPSSKIVLMGYSQGAQVIGDSISGELGVASCRARLIRQSVGGGTGEPGGQIDNPTTPISECVGKNGESLTSRRCTTLTLSSRRCRAFR